MDCSPPGSPVHGILQARILEWVAILHQGIFPTHISNPCLLCLLCCRQILYLLSHQGSTLSEEKSWICACTLAQTHTHARTHTHTHKHCGYGGEGDRILLSEGIAWGSGSLAKRGIRVVHLVIISRRKSQKQSCYNLTLAEQLQKWP